MIRRYILHLEWNRGYRPRVSLRRAPRGGDRVMDGGEPGQLMCCHECGSTGFMFRPDRQPASLTETLRGAYPIEDFDG